MKKIEDFKTTELPGLAEQNGCNWNPDVCLNFLDDILNNIKEIFSDGNSIGDSVVEISWCPVKKHVTYTKSEESRPFLQDWYLEARQEN